MTFVRSLLFRVVLFASSPILAIVLSPALLFGRQGVRYLAKVWARMVLLELRFFCGISHRVEGAENMPQGGGVVAANHQSMWETIALYALLPKSAFIVKRELENIPVFGWFLRPAGNIVIDRQGGAKALRAMTRAAQQIVEGGGQIIVFPEGTRVQPGQHVEFQPGLAGVYKAVAAPCYPVAHDSGRFWRHPGPEKTPGVITIRFLPPIPANLERKRFLSEVQTAIEAARPDLEDGAPATAASKSQKIGGVNVA